MILLTTLVYTVAWLLGFLLLAGYVEMVERWMDSRRTCCSVSEVIVFLACGAALIGIYAGLVDQVFVWVGWVGV